MKKIKNIVFSLLLLFLVFIPTIKSTKTNANETLSVAIVQLVSHPSLDEITNGIYDGLENIGYIKDNNLTIDYHNAEGDMNLLNTISQQVVQSAPDIIFGITTPVAQSLQNATEEIPIIFVGVTDPLSAKLVDSLESPGGNITGVSDAMPLDVQFELLKEILPEAKTVGLLYTTSEDNSEAETQKAKKAAEEIGLMVEIEGISSALDVKMVAESLVTRVDAIFMGADNTIASAFGALVDATDSAGIPIITTINEFIEQGALAGRGIRQYDTGFQAGIFAEQIINGKYPGDLPVEFVEDLVFMFNQEAAELLDIELSEALMKEAQNYINGEFE